MEDPVSLFYDMMSSPDCHMGAPLSPAVSVTTMMTASRPILALPAELL